MNPPPFGEDGPVYAVRLSPAASAQAVAEYDRLTQTAHTEAGEDPSEDAAETGEDTPETDHTELQKAA